jgi:hypothetical protein
LIFPVVFASICFFVIRLLLFHNGSFAHFQAAQNTEAAAPSEPCIIFRIHPYHCRG